MKTLKLAVVALSLGFFAASCGGNTETTETTVDTAAMTTQPEATTPEATTPVVDSPATPVVDTPAAAATPAK